MSLYEGLGVPLPEKGDTSDVKWSAGLKLLQSQIQLKKATLTQVKREKLRSQQPSAPVVTPVVDLSSRSKNNKDKTLSALVDYSSSLSEGPADVDLPPLAFVTARSDARANLLFGEVEVVDEYNPMFPNDFEKIQLRKEADKAEQRDEERRRERDGEERSSRKRREIEDEDDSGSSQDRRRSFLSGAAIAPPQSLLEEDIKITQEISSQLPPATSPTVRTEKGLGVAAKIMEKYGYKHGQGLGKLEQGMSTALQVEKLGKRGGKIVHERDIPKVETLPQQQLSHAEPITEILKNATKVLMLRNMVGPGEVDMELEGEVKEECSKYGEVKNVIVFEIPDPPSDDEAVRIFIEFSQVESAIKGALDLNGRFFGGRPVKVSFYDEEKFIQFELSE